MKHNTTLYTAALLAALICSSNALAKKVPAQLGFGVTQLHKKMEKENRLDELSSDFKAFYKRISSGNHNCTDEEAAQIAKEARKHGRFRVPSCAFFPEKTA